jgi:hypothetical protein
VKQCERRSTNSIGTIYVAATADIIGAAWHPALKGEADNARRAYRPIGEFTAQIISFRGFFYFRSASPFSGVRIAGPIVLVQHKGHERIGKARMPFAVLCLLL